MMLHDLTESSGRVCPSLPSLLSPAEVEPCHISTTCACAGNSTTRVCVSLTSTAMPSSPPHQPPPRSSDAAAQQGVSPANRKVSFDAHSPRAGKHQAPPSKAAPPAAAAASCPDADTHVNQLFSPSGPARQDSWTIEAQRSDRPPMAEPGSSSSSAANAAALDCSPASNSLLGSYTPASAGYLESARKVDDLRGRLESLEAALREMESKAVAQLDRSLQDKVLATAGGCSRCCTAREPASQHNNEDVMRRAVYKHLGIPDVLRWSGRLEPCMPGVSTTEL